MTSADLAERYGLKKPKGDQEELLADMCDAFALGGENQLASACARAIRQCQTVRGTKNASKKD